MNHPWTPATWQEKTNHQAISYSNTDELGCVLSTLSQTPPLISGSEIETLKSQLSEAAEGKRFILQGGDCAESFADCDAHAIRNKLKILLQMSLILLHGVRKPIIRVGRIAGQFAKPRSDQIETRDGISLPSYRGDLINGSAFQETVRQPDPKRLLQGYHHAATCLNYIRSLLDEGFADLQHASQWLIDFDKESEHAHIFMELTQKITDAFQMLKTLDGINVHAVKQLEFFTSHEAFHLDYEQALTHQVDNGKWYNLGTHYPWLGMRTAIKNSAHIEYLRGIANPIGIKVGPDADCDWIVELVKILNPDNEPWRITLITRYGEQYIEKCLPPLIKKIQQAKLTVLWSCDPMHGNTQFTESGLKTRRFDTILSELKKAFTLHQKMGSQLGGVHFELTGENVTECVGGTGGLTEADLTQAYETLLDPRLNYQQSIEMALLIAEQLSFI